MDEKEMIKKVERALIDAEFQDVEISDSGHEIFFGDEEGNSWAIEISRF